MILASRLLVALAVTGVFAAPLGADVVPSQYASSPESKAKVQSRLTEMGLPSAEARNRAARLTEDEAAYFALNPARLQVVGRQEMWGGQSDNFWWEWVGGALALAGVALFLATRD